MVKITQNSLTVFLWQRCLIIAYFEGLLSKKKNSFWADTKHARATVSMSVSAIGVIPGVKSRREVPQETKLSSLAWDLHHRWIPDNVLYGELGSTQGPKTWPGLLCNKEILFIPSIVAPSISAGEPPLRQQPFFSVTVDCAYIYFLLSSVPRVAFVVKVRL